MNLLALILAGILKSKFRDAGRSLLSDDLQALNHSGHHFVLQPGIQALGVLAHDDEVNIRIARGDVRQITNRPEVRVQLKLLAQRHVDAGKTAAYGRGDRPLQSHARALDRFDYLFGDVLAMFLEGIGPHGERFPLELHAGRFQNTHRGPRHFGADAIAGNQSNFMCHIETVPAYANFTDSFSCKHS
jgi:hypothetical protein